MNAAIERPTLSTPIASAVKLEASMPNDCVHSPSTCSDDASVDNDDRAYYGKCQYKTGKCFNERTLKRNGEVHSLCEEHRIKQNLIQRRSDRKYQTVHALRRRERSQRRAVLKKQVSMAVAQQLFYEHQQQKTMGVHLAVSTAQHAHAQAQAPPQPLSRRHAMVASLANAHPAAASVASLLSPSSLLSHHSPFLSSSTEGLASPMLSFTAPSAFSFTNLLPRSINRSNEEKKAEAEDEVKSEEDKDQSDGVVKCEATTRTGTGRDDFTPDTFLTLCSSDEHAAFMAFPPIISVRGERELWTDADIDFLQTLLMA